MVVGRYPGLSGSTRFPELSGGRVRADEFTPFVDGVDYPVFVVTAAGPDGPAGCLVGFATQVSIDPPRLLVCLSIRNRTFRVAENADHLAVHLLDAHQHDLAELFGGTTSDEIDKFARCRWHEGPGGAPVLDDAPRHLVGSVLSRHPFGDHVGVLLEPVEVDVGARDATLTFQQVRDVDPGHDA
jgi:flavin reductase (DIM6/NTAB) family NADH-FMN oxidoreductase RutF